MQTFVEWFWLNLSSNIFYSIFALIVAIIFVAVLEQFFDIRLKDPGNYRFNMKDPVGKVPIIRNPMRK